MMLSILQSSSPQAQAYSQSPTFAFCNYFTLLNKEIQTVDLYYTTAIPNVLRFPRCLRISNLI